MLRSRNDKPQLLLRLAFFRPCDSCSDDGAAFSAEADGIEEDILGIGESEGMEERVGFL